MKSLIALLLPVLAVLPVLAQDAAAERERLKVERAAADAHYAEQQKACRAKFAVNDCIDKARRDYNRVVADLRRQENVLNDADRRRRAEERRRELDERHSPQAQQEAAERRAKAVEEQKDRERRAAEKAAKRAGDEAARPQEGSRGKTADGPPGPQGKPRADRTPKAGTITADEAAKNRQAHEARVREAEAHKAEVRDRIAKRRQPAASDLPMPK